MVKHGCLLKISLCLLFLVTSCYAQMPALAEASLADALDEPSVILSPQNYHGPCPVTIRAAGKLNSSRAGLLQYRWLHQGFPGEIRTVRLTGEGAVSVSESFNGIGRTPRPGTLVLSGAQVPELMEGTTQQSGSVQLLSLPFGEPDWTLAKKSAEQVYSVVCNRPTAGSVYGDASETMGIQLGPLVTVGRVQAPWGTSLVVDASAFLVGRRNRQCALPFSFQVTHPGEVAPGKLSFSLFKGTSALVRAVPVVQTVTPETIAAKVFLGNGRHLLQLKLKRVDAQGENSTESIRQFTVMVRGCSA